MSVKNYSDKHLFELLVSIIFREMRNGDVSIKNISKSMSLSSSQLNRRVKAARGITISEFVMQIRIKEAKRLLAMTRRYTIGDVASMCGFYDTSHMGHVFQKKVGTSPTHYQESVAKKPEDLNKFISEQLLKAEKKMDEARKRQ